MDTCVNCGAYYGDSHSYGNGYCPDCRRMFQQQRFLKEQAEKARKQAEEQAERIRKQDPKNWYGNEWAEYLSKHPEAASQCDWSKLRGEDLAVVLINQPQIVPKELDWPSRLSNDVWLKLLLSRPRFFERCSDLASLGSTAWYKLLLKHPSLRDYCKCFNFTSEQWLELLQKYPSLAEGHDSVWNKFSSDQWYTLLIASPGFVCHCPESSFDKFSPDQWVKILLDRPEWVKYCSEKSFAKLSPAQWLVLLDRHPEFERHYVCGNVENWQDVIELLSKYPVISSRFDFEKLSGFSPSQWLVLLDRRPEFATRCVCENVDEWQALVLIELLSKYPDVVSRLDFKKLAKEVWQRMLHSAPGLSLFENNPKILENCNFEGFSVSDWAIVVSINANLADKCVCWNRFRNKEWVSVLKKRPEHIDRLAKKEILNGSDWCAILLEQPNLIGHCDCYSITSQQWERLAGKSDAIDRKRSEIFKILSKAGIKLTPDHPTIHDEGDWKRLLKREPRFIKRMQEEAPEVQLNKKERGGHQHKIGCFSLSLLAIAIFIMGVVTCVGLSYVKSDIVPNRVRPTVEKFSQTGNSIRAKVSALSNKALSSLDKDDESKRQIDGGSQAESASTSPVAEDRSDLWSKAKYGAIIVGAIVILILLRMLLPGLAEGGVIAFVGRVAVLGWCSYKTVLVAMGVHDLALVAIMAVVALWILINVSRGKSRPGWWRWLLLAGCYSAGLTDLTSFAIAGAVALILGPAKLK